MLSLLRMHYSDIETRARIARHKRRIFHQPGRLLVRWREHTVGSIGSIRAHVSTLVGWLVGWLVHPGILKSPLPVTAPATKPPDVLSIYIYLLYIYTHMYVRTCIYTHVGNGRTSKRCFEHASHTSGTRVYLTSLVPQNYPLKGRRYTG